MRRAAARARRPRPSRAEFAINKSARPFRLMRRVDEYRPHMLQSAELRRTLSFSVLRWITASGAVPARGSVWLRSPRAVRWARARLRLPLPTLLDYTPDHPDQCDRCTLLDIARALGAGASYYERNALAHEYVMLEHVIRLSTIQRLAGLWRAY